jgi:hypothetical protein
MDTLELILAELRKTPTISVVNTVVNGNDCTFTIYQILPCSDDIYAVFIDRSQPQPTLYALQNVGAQFWCKWSNGIDEDKYFLLPITNYLITDRENCLATYYKWCRQSELGNIPIVKEEFVNPFLPKE